MKKEQIIVKDKTGKKIFEYKHVDPLKKCRKELETAPFGIVRSVDPSHFCRFGKWKVIEEEVGFIGTKIVQERICKTCNYKEIDINHY